MPVTTVTVTAVTIRSDAPKKGLYRTFYFDTTPWYLWLWTVLFDDFESLVARFYDVYAVGKCAHIDGLGAGRQYPATDAVVYCHCCTGHTGDM